MSPTESNLLATIDPASINLDAVKSLADTATGDDGKNIDTITGPFMILAATVKPNTFAKGTPDEREGKITSMLAIIDPERPIWRELYSNSDYVASKVEALLAEGVCTPTAPVVVRTLEAKTQAGRTVYRLTSANDKDFGDFMGSLRKAFAPAKALSK